MKLPKNGLVNRELSWLSFSYRILQEAKDHRVPLYERVKFLGIFSSNLDEYFRMRVASLKSLLLLKRKEQKKLSVDPEKLLMKILDVVEAQQEECGNTFRKQIIPELAKQNVMLITERALTGAGWRGLSSVPSGTWTSTTRVSPSLNGMSSGSTQRTQ